MKILIYVLFASLIIISFSASIDYGKLFKEINLSYTQASSILENIKTYKKIISNLDKKISVQENEILDTVWNIHTDNIKYYNNLLKERDLKLKEFKNKIAFILNQRQKNIVKSLNYRLKTKLDLNTIYLATEKYLKITTIATEISSESGSDILVKIIVGQKITPKQVISINNLLFKSINEIDTINLLIKNIKGNCNDCKFSKEEEDKLKSSQDKIKSITSKAYETIKEILGDEVYYNIITEYKNELINSIIEKILYNEKRESMLKKICSP
jgi:hypothetical protein